MRWMEHPVFFVDFEGSLATGVLEYGVATLLGGRVTATLTRLCAPTGRVRAEDTEVHGRPRIRRRHPSGGAGDRDPDPAVRADGPRAGRGHGGPRASSNTASPPFWGGG